MDKFKIFSGVLYPDSSSYDCEQVLSLVSSKFKDWAFILHDQDSNDDGSLKKAHYHWVGRGDPRSLSSVSRFLHIPEHDIEIGKNFNLLVQYLIHQNDQSKFQYDPSLVTSNFDLSKVFRKLSEGELVLDLIHYKFSHSWYQTIVYASQVGSYDVFRRNCSIISLVQNEMAGSSNG